MKNIIVITADSVRADHLDLYGYSRPTTPRMSEISNRIRFSKAWANAPYTPASMPSLFTGQYLLEEGHLALRDFTTVQDLLQATGARTCLVNSNIQLDRFGCTDGWDKLINISMGDSMDNDRSQKFSVKNLSSQILNHDRVPKQASALLKDTYHRFAGPAQPHPPDTRLLDAAREWLAGQKPPVYLHLHLMNTHHPYTFSAEIFEHLSRFSFDRNRYARLLQRALTHVKDGEFVWSLNKEERQYLIDAYDASIRELDELIANFIAELDLSETAVVFTSDHGEELWDHGHFGHTGYQKKPRQTTLYEEVIHVPLIIFHKEYYQETVETPVSLIDIAPTVIDIVGEESHSTEFHGQSLIKTSTQEPNPNRPAVAQATSPGEPTHYAQYENTHRLAAVKIGEWKYIYNEATGDELYDLSSDREEKHNINDIRNVSPQHRNLVERYMPRKETAQVSYDGTLDRSTEETLRDLGYL